MTRCPEGKRLARDALNTLNAAIADRPTRYTLDAARAALGDAIDAYDAAHTASAAHRRECREVV